MTDRHQILFEYSANVQPYALSAKALRKEVDALNASLLASGTLASGVFNSAQADLINNLRSMKNWTTQAVSMENGAVQLGKAIEANNLSMGRQKKLLKEYRSGIVGARGEISELAKEQVRMSRSQILFTTGADGKRMAQVSTPRGIDMKDAATRTAAANQELKVYNRLLAQNAEQTINLGKNTQWAGRQIMVGMTIPMMMFGAVAKNVFIEVDKEMTRLGKVYGAGLEGASDKAVENIKGEVGKLGKELAAAWGVSVKDTAGLAAQVAATGKEGNDLLVSTREAMRLSVLGEVDRQTAMEATLSIQNAFKLSNEELAESIDFLNAVENQTSTSLEDLTIAIPKAGPVVKSLGGDVKDLSALLVAMKEGGIDAAEGANALKSGLASLINPSKQATEVASDLGIDLVNIVEKNKGKLIPTITEFQKALQGLDEFSRAKLIEQIFGKYQFARISALFENFGKQGSQTQQVFELMGASVSELAANSEREMKRLTESTSMRWQRTLESLKANLLPIGESITKVFTALAQGLNVILEGFNALPAPVKSLLGLIAGVAAVVGPILMLVGIFGNFVGQLQKGYAILRGRRGGMFSMLTADVMAAQEATTHLVDAQFDEVAALKEINSVMEQQVLLLRELAKGYSNVASASAAPQGGNLFGGAMPRNTGADPSTAGLSAQQIMGPALTNPRTGGFNARTLLANSTEAAKGFVGQIGPETMQGRYLGVAKEMGISAESSNAAGEAIRKALASGAEDTGLAAGEAFRDSLKASGVSSEAASMAQSLLMRSIGREDLIPEKHIQAIASLDKELHDAKNGKGGRISPLTTVVADASATGVRMHVPEGGYASSHVVPDSKGGEFSQQLVEGVKRNLLQGDSEIKDPLSRISSEAELNAHNISMLAANMVGEGGPETAATRVKNVGKKKTSDAKLYGLSDNELSSLVDRVFAGLEPRLRKLVAQAEAAGVAVEDLANGLLETAVGAQAAADSVSASEAAVTEARARQRASTEEVKSAQKRLDLAKASEVEARKELKTKVASTAESKAAAQKFLDTVANSKAKGVPEARARIQSAVDGKLTGAKLAAEIKSALSGISSTAATELRAALSPVVKASAAALSRAQAEVKAAELALNAAKSQDRSSRQQVLAAREQLRAAQQAERAASKAAMAAELQAMAAEKEMIAAEPDVTDFDGGGAPGGRRRGGFLSRAEGQATGLGMGAMAVGQLTGNDAVTQFGFALSSVGMLAIGFQTAQGALTGMSAAAARAGLSLNALSASGAKGGVTGLLGGVGKGLGRLVGAINPVTIALAAAAAGAFLVWKKYEDIRDRMKRDEASKSVQWDIIGLKSGDPRTFADRGKSGVSQADMEASRQEYENSEGAKAVTDQVKAGRDDIEKASLLENSYRANYLALEAAYSTEEKKNSEEYKKKKASLDAMYAIIAEESEMADKWEEIKERGSAGLAGTLKKRRDEAAELKRVLSETSTAEGMLGAYASGVGAGYGVDAKTTAQEVADLRAEIVNNLPTDFSNALKAAIGTGDNGVIAKTVMDQVDSLSQLFSDGLLTEENFNSISSKIEELTGVDLGNFDDFNQSAMEADGAIGQILADLNLIPQHILTNFTFTITGDKEEIMAFLAAIAKSQSEFSDFEKGLTDFTKIEALEQISEAAFDKMVDGIEDANEAAQEAHEAAQERREEEIDGINEVIDAKNEQIDSIQDEIEKIEEVRDERKKALEEAKEADDYFRSQRKSQIEYLTAMESGDYAGAAQIQTDMQQAEADFNFDQANEKIDKEADTAIGGKETKIEGVEKQIEDLEARIEVINDVSEAADKAFQAEQKIRQKRLEDIRENKDAWIKAENKKRKASYDAEVATRDAAIETARVRAEKLQELVEAGMITEETMKIRAGAIADDLAKELGWGAEKTAKFKAEITNPLMDAWADVLDAAGIDDPRFNQKRAAVRAKYIKDEATLNARYERDHSGAFVSSDHTTGREGLGSDEVTRILQTGEYVVQRSAVKKYGRGMFDKLNAGRFEGRGKPGAIQVATGSKIRSALATKMLEFAQDKFFPEMAALKYGFGPSSPPSSSAVKWSGTDYSGASVQARSAIGRAMADMTNEIGYCLRQVREWWGVPGRYGSAAIAWQNASRRHADSSPKLGAPVFWTGGSQGYGHVAMYVGNGKVRSTDAAGPGRVGTVPIGRFGGSLNYQGWTEDLNGIALQLRKGGMVLKDNTLANLHRGETVLRAPLASGLEEGIRSINRVPDIMRNMNSGDSVVDRSETKNYFNISQLPGESTEELADRILEKQQQIAGRTGRRR